MANRNPEGKAVRGRWSAWLVATAWPLLVAPAHAHTLDPQEAGGVSIWRWNFEPHIIINLLWISGVYALGVKRVWSQCGWGKVVPAWRVACFAAGIAACVLALVSPIDILSAQLGSVHMVQHMILMNVAAPLLVLGTPVLVLLWSLGIERRRKWGKRLQWLNQWPSRYYVLWQPIILWAVYAFSLWIWHLPRFYQAALRNELVHDLQHLVFVASACLFWRVLFDPLSHCRLNRGAGVIYLFTTSLHATVLGVFMALSPAVWYPDYEPFTPAFSLTALQDQQIAGLIMWMPACALYAVAAAVIFGIWLRDSEQSNRQRIERKPA